MLVEEKQVDAIRPKQHFHFCEWRFEKKMAQFFVLAVQRLLQSGFFYQLDDHIELLNASRIQLEKVNIAKWLKSLF